MYQARDLRKKILVDSYENEEQRGEDYVDSPEHMGALAYAD